MNWELGIRSVFLLGCARVVPLVGFLGDFFAFLLLNPAMGMEKKSLGNPHGERADG